VFSLAGGFFCFFFITTLLIYFSTIQNQVPILLKLLPLLLIAGASLNRFRSWLAHHYFSLQPLISRRSLKGFDNIEFRHFDSPFKIA
jgi:hypothetical protein